MPLPQKKLIPAILFALMVAALAAPPLWWSESTPPVLNANPINNKGPANIGQAKHMAKSALDALYPILPATAAAIEADLVGFGKPIPSWAAPANQAEKDRNHAPLLIGQLKAIADPFYTRLHAAAPAWLEAERITNGTNHPNSIFPWTAETTDDANKAIANIGQLKAVFSLRFESLSPADPNDTDGDGLPNEWEIAHGLNPNDNGSTDPQSGASGLFQNDPVTNGQAFSQGVQADPNATLDDKDGDSLANGDDAEPLDGEINWEKTPEASYVWVEQLERTGAKAVSRHGHIHFPTIDNGISDLSTLQVLWDSNTSGWVNLAGSSTWSGSGYWSDEDPDVFDHEWKHIDGMNDEGVVVGRSKYEGPNTPVAWVLTSAIMKWRRSGTATDQYAEPVYTVPGFNYIDPWGDLEEYLVDQEAPRIADDGTVSAMSYHVSYPDPYGDWVFKTKWVTGGANQAGHSSGMGVWAAFDGYLENQYHPAAVLGNDAGLLVEHHAGIPETVLHYRNGAVTESLEGLLGGTEHAIRDTDIGRTPATGGNPAGRVWFSVKQDPGNSAFLEKRAGGSGVSRWHKPPSMAEGAIRLNARGEAITPTKIWRNGTYTPINDLVPKPESSDLSVTKLIDLASNGLILAEATDGGVTKTGLLRPLDFSVFPPEPTEDEIAAAGDERWEIETFQIPADDPELWIQANLFVGACDEDGNPAMVPVADGSVVTWEIVDDESDSGASLSSTTSETENGYASIKLTTSTVPGNRFKVRGKLTTLKIPTGGENVETIISQEGFAEIRTQLFEVVPGNVSSISMTAVSQTMPADGASELLVEAVLTDSAGNPAARGTDVNWRIKGGGHIQTQDHLIVGQDGKATAMVVPGTVAASQIITAEADGVTAEISLTNTPVQLVSLTPSAAVIDLATGQSTTITLQASGVEDGAEISWDVSKGRLSGQDSVVQGNGATATLIADAGTIGTATVIATVGDAVVSCEVVFESSSPASVEVTQPLLVHDATADGSENVTSLSEAGAAIPYFTSTPITIRSPGNPGAWVTVGFGGARVEKAYSYGFDEQIEGTVPSFPAGLPAILGAGAAVVTDQGTVGQGAGSLYLTAPASTATLEQDASLSLDEGSTIRFSLRPGETDGQVFSKAGEYTATLLPDGHLLFTLGSGQQATSLTSPDPLDMDEWEQITVSIRSGRLLLEVGGIVTEASIAGFPPHGTGDLVIGGFTGHFDSLAFSHRHAGFQGITLVTTGLDAQNRAPLDANGEATITVTAQTVGAGPPDDTLGQTVDLDVQIGGQTFTAKEAITVTDKGSAVLIRAIAGQTAVIGTSTQSLDRAEMASQFLRRGIRAADRAGALPSDMGGDAAARGECGFLIAVWMEETVDEAGIVRPLMSVTAQNLPPEVGEVLNWMLAEMMVSAGQRGESEAFADYILRNHGELLLALQSLSAGDIPQFLALAGALDGDGGFGNVSAVTQQVGAGVIEAIAKAGLNEAGNAYDNIRTWFNGQNWGIEMRERGDGVAALRQLQKSIIETVAGNASGTKEVIKICSEYLLAEGVIDPEATAALGFAYGVVEKLDELGQDVAQPELLAQTAMQLADLTISAVGGDVQAREALKEIGGMAVIAPISTIPETADAWEQGHYFQAGSNAVAVVEVALVAKFVKDLAVKSTRKALLWGRHRTTDWQASYAHIGKTAEALAFKRLRSKGFRDIVPIRNESNHGIDWVCRDRNGGVVFIEVKGHRLDAAPKLSRSQKDMKAFTESRLQQAILGQGHWANVSEEVVSNARNIINEIKRPGSTVRGYVVNVDYAVSKLPKVRYYEWLNGVGDLVNPNP